MRSPPADRRRRCKRLHSSRNGYLLVVTLLMIAIVGALTIGLARHSMNMAVATIDDELELQAKWGAISCERFAFLKVRDLLSEQAFDEQTGKAKRVPVARSTCDVALGGQLFRIRLDDESAKLNLNFVDRWKPASGVVDAIREFSKTELAIEPTPMPLSARRGPDEDGFESWGQLLVADRPLPGPLAVEYQLASDSLTCWSNQLNVLTAPNEVIVKVVEILGGATNASRLSELNEDRSNLDEIVAQLSLPEDRMQELRKLMKRTSTCQSIWIESVSRRGSQFSLTVREEYDGSIIRMKSFSW